MVRLQADGRVGSAVWSIRSDSWWGQAVCGGGWWDREDRGDGWDSSVVSVLSVPSVPSVFPGERLHHQRRVAAAAQLEPQRQLQPPRVAVIVRPGVARRADLQPGRPLAAREEQ